MPDLAQADYRKIRHINPVFHLPYIEYAEKLAASGNETEANKIRVFISKLFA